MNEKRLKKNRKKVLHRMIAYDIISEHLGNKLKVNGALEKRLTHMPFTHAFTGSNPVRVTICQ